jgi:hypothetical protein
MKVHKLVRPLERGNQKEPDYAEDKAYQQKYLMIWKLFCTAVCHIFGISGLSIVA